MGKSWEKPHWQPLLFPQEPSLRSDSQSWSLPELATSQRCLCLAVHLNDLDHTWILPHCSRLVWPSLSCWLLLFTCVQVLWPFAFRCCRTAPSSVTHCPACLVVTISSQIAFLQAEVLSCCSLTPLSSLL